MKKTLLSILMIVTSLMTFAQSNNLIYSVSRSNTDLTVYDTTGGVFTVYATRPITGASYSKGLGIALNPNSNEMYVLFEDGSGNSSRRLGTIDTLSGVITDIGFVGDLRGITYDFSLNKLYGVSNTTGPYGLYEINTTDGTITQLVTHSSSEYGSGIVYDYYKDSLLYIAYSSGNMSYINTTDFAENLTSSNYSSETHGGLIINDSITWIYTTWQGMSEYNKNSQTVTAIPSSNLVPGTHSLAFGSAPLIVKSSGPTTFCSSESVTLSLNEVGTSYQWELNGSAIPGETNATLVPTTSGAYSCLVDAKMSLPLTITILPSPVVSYTATPSNVDLAVDPTGTVVFANTTPTGNEYSWDFGNGFTTSNENPSFPFTNVGSFDVTLYVTDNTNGCMDSLTQTITVVSTVGLTTLENDFTVFPNPTNGIFGITINSELESYDATVIDLNGRTIKTITLSTSSENKIDLSKEENGIYLLKINNKDKEVFYRIVKQ